MSHPRNIKNSIIDLTNDSDDDSILEYCLFSSSARTGLPLDSTLSSSTRTGSPGDNTSVKFLKSVTSGVMASRSVVKKSTIKKSSKQKYSVRSLPSTIVVGANKEEKSKERKFKLDAKLNRLRLDE